MKRSSGSRSAKRAAGQLRACDHAVEVPQEQQRLQQSCHHVTPRACGGRRCAGPLRRDGGEYFNDAGGALLCCKLGASSDDTLQVCVTQVKNKRKRCDESDRHPFLNEKLKTEARQARITSSSIPRGIPFWHETLYNYTLYL